MEILPADPGFLVPRCRYQHLAEALCRELHISLDSALQYTPFEAYQALGAEIYV
ncbi:MAG: hypothetical protein RIT02_2653 [Planctomycetota bacterium]|jgi:hypothetical protein